MQLIMSWAGTLILAAYVSESEVGIYNAIVRISSFTTITVLAVNSGMMPRFAVAHSEGNKTELKALSAGAVRIIFYSSLPIFLFLVAGSGLVLKLFGTEFPGHEAALYTMLGGQFIVVAAGLPSQILTMTDRQDLMRTISIVAAISNIVSCFILIPISGVVGACIAQVIGMVVWNVLCNVYVYKKLGFFSFIRF
jgi:O-antigen/teichoic acid export membrane protein